MTDAPGGWPPPPEQPPQQPPPQPPPPPPYQQPPPSWAPPPPQQPAYQQPPPAYQQPPPAPPGQYAQGYGYTAGPGGVAKGLGGLTTALQILLGVSGVASLFSAFVLFDRASLIDTDFTLQEAEDADAAVAAALGLTALVTIATIVVWLVWQHRHAKNAELLGQRGGLGAGWAIGGWFIPVANVVLGPLQLFQSSKWSDAQRPGNAATPPSLIVWWALLAVGLISRFGAGFGSDAVDDARDLEDIQRADQIGGFSSILAVGAAITAIVMVRALARRQREALEARQIQVV